MAARHTELGRLTRTFAQLMGAAQAWLVAEAQLEDVLAQCATEAGADASAGADVPIGTDAAPDMTADAASVVRVAVLSERNELCDLRAWGRACREPAERAKRAGLRGSDPARRNKLLVADVSSVSCACCAAARWGAHLAVDDLSLLWEPEAQGPANLRAVGLSRDAERTRPGLRAALDTAQQACVDAGALDADSCALLAGGLATLEARLHERADAAAAVAAFLSCHPRVGGVRYPGLPEDAAHEAATCLLTGGFGPQVVWWRTDASAEACERVVVGTGQDPRAICEDVEQRLRA